MFYAFAMFYALVCSAMRPGDFVPTSYLSVLVLNCDYWFAGVDAWSPRAVCAALFGAALCSMPRAFLSCWSSSIVYLLLLPALRVGELWLCGAGGFARLV